MFNYMKLNIFNFYIKLNTHDSIYIMRMLVISDREMALRSLVNATIGNPLDIPGVFDGEVYSVTTSVANAAGSVLLDAIGGEFIPLEAVDASQHGREILLVVASQKKSFLFRLVSES